MTSIPTGKPRGRPPIEFKPEYCDMLTTHMSQGYSFETFAADIDVCKDTLYAWVDQYPEFSDAKKRAFIKCQKFWESLGIGAACGEIKFFDTGSWIFNMKNRFKWTDKMEISGDEDKPILMAYDPTKRLNP